MARFMAALSASDWGVVAVFAAVYLGMFLGGLPMLRLDRAGVRLPPDREMDRGRPVS